jgi:hypothetical protein
MCFSLQWWENLFVFLIGIGAAIAIIRLFIPWAAQNWSPVLGQALDILMKAVIAIIVVIIVFGLISCLLGGGLSIPRLR